ncbi:MAG: iron-containing alcohol dehydrogenase [Acidobacteria bacterium]|nr:iron-containing alcohol dehydrogenase [Acidobacteriota bacterium]
MNNTSLELRCRNLEIGNKCIPFYYGFDCLDEILYRIEKLKADRFLIVTDSCVKELYGEKLKQMLERKTPTLLLASPPGERSKTMEVLLKHAETAIRWGATRRSVVVALGGGVPSNLAGLMASLMFRGIRLVHIPTTIVNMFDAVISFKQAVNTHFSKNLLGTYYVPTLVLADLKYLSTLPRREIMSGICETIKNALAIQPESIKQLCECLSPEHNYDFETLVFLLEFSLNSKIKVMVDDKFEKGRALILEYGHTIGHVLELLDQCRHGNHGISHGEAIGLGMLNAALISNWLGGLDDNAVEVHYDLLSRVGVRRFLPNGITVEEVLEYTRFDNKRGHLSRDQGNQLDMILLRHLGTPMGPLEKPLTSVPLNLIEKSLRSFQNVFNNN